jgi:exodeoxyribonuclease-3
VLSRQPIEVIAIGIPGFDDEQRRVLAVRTAGLVVVNLYGPNGQAPDSDKYAYKLRWLEAFIQWLEAELQQFPSLAVLGDYNIAPADADVHDPAAWQDQVLVSAPERAAFERLCAMPLADAFRLFPQAEKLYSWWDYRQMAFRRNRGLRIDHILLSPALAQRCTACEIDKLPRKWEQPSDHTPVIATLQ